MKTSKIFTVAAAAFAAAVSFTSVASATVFQTDYHDPGIWTAYDDVNETYGFKFRDDGDKDGFWLVVSDGPNPKKNANEYAILYGDREANRITAYTYDGENNANSFQTGTFLGTYENAFAAAGTHPTQGYDLTMFKLDVAAINGAFGGEWDGVAQGEQSGIWFHQSADSNFTYGADGEITGYNFGSQMFVDKAFADAQIIVASKDCAGADASKPGCNNSTGFNPSGNIGGGAVPAPGGLALIFAGLIGLRRMRARA